MADSAFPPSVFDRLLKDRIIWLGSEVRDENANEIAAKLLLLAAEDSKKDISLYIKKVLFELISQHTGQDLAQVEQDADRDRWFTAQEALEYGFVDHIRETALDVAEVTAGESKK